MPTLVPRPVDERTRKRPFFDLDLELDPVQKRAVLRPPGSAMLVLGEAGHGKTTVALHRLAHLYATAVAPPQLREARGAPKKRRFRAAVIVPSEGLARLLQPLVTRLGADVHVLTYDVFAQRQARRAFGDIPRRESVGLSAAGSRLKRDPAVRPILEELSHRPPGRIDDDEDAPLPNTKAHAHRGDLQHLFGDRLLVEAISRASVQGLARHAPSDVLEHTFVQFSARTEHEYAHVDKRRLKSADSLSIDEGTPMEDAESIDVEDYAVLFELDRLRAHYNRVPATRISSFDCLVVDEAQELAPLELALIGRSLGPRGTLVVAGDADQQIDPGACFGGWEATMRELGAAHHESVVLEVGYRCPPGVVAFARAIRSGIPADLRGVSFAEFADEPALRVWLVHELMRLDELDPEATTAIITRSPKLARRIAAALRGNVPCRLVLDGEFVFHRGVDVTTVEQVKGLEFDNVVVPDATRAEYPDSPASRRAMYVAATRARHQLALAGVGERSPLLDSAPMR
jgi:superfamily I DNA/RNA helicase